MKGREEQFAALMERAGFTARQIAPATGETCRNTRDARQRFRDAAPQMKRHTVVAQLASYVMLLKGTDTLAVVRQDGSVWTLTPNGD